MAVINPSILLTADWSTMTKDNLQTLLKHGAKANAYDEDGWTPLMHACFEHAPMDVIQTLVQNGRACVNAANPINGITALMIASRHHSKAVVRYLIDAGADQSATDKWNWRPRHYALFRQSATKGRQRQ